VEVLGFAVMSLVVGATIVWMFHVAGFRRSRRLTVFEERRPWAAILMGTASRTKREEMLPTPFERTRRAMEVVLKVVVVTMTALLLAVLAAFGVYLFRPGDVP
jgi:hypothetical protein